MKRPRNSQNRRTEKGHHRVAVRGRGSQRQEASRAPPSDAIADPSTDDAPFTNADYNTRTPLPAGRATEETWRRHARYLSQIDLRTELLLVLLRNKEWIAGRDLLADLARDGLLTEEWLRGLLQDPTLGRRTHALVNAALEAFRRPSDGAPGKVWFPLVFPPEEGVGSWCVAPRVLTCHVAQDVVPAFTTSSAMPWRQRLEAVAEAVAGSLCSVVPNASPRWFLEGVTFGLLRTTGLPEISPRDDGFDPNATGDSPPTHGAGGSGLALRGEGSFPPSVIRSTDESFELAAAVSMMSAAFGQKLEYGTAAMGRVDKETGRILPLGEPWISIKCQGFAAALPALVRLYVSREEDIERVRSLLPRIDIVRIAYVSELAMTIDVHQDEFVGMKSTSTLLRAWDVLKRLPFFGGKSAYLTALDRTLAFSEETVMAETLMDLLAFGALSWALAVSYDSIHWTTTAWIAGNGLALAGILWTFCAFRFSRGREVAAAIRAREAQLRTLPLDSRTAQVWVALPSVVQGLYASWAAIWICVVPATYILVDVGIWRCANQGKTAGFSTHTLLVLLPILFVFPIPWYLYLRYLEPEYTIDRIARMLAWKAAYRTSKLACWFVLPAAVSHGFGPAMIPVFGAALAILVLTCRRSPERDAGYYNALYRLGVGRMWLVMGTLAVGVAQIGPWSRREFGLRCLQPSLEPRPHVWITITLVMVGVLIWIVALLWFWLYVHRALERLDRRLELAAPDAGAVGK